MKVFSLHQDCRFEATYKSHQCWCRMHTNQIKIKFLIDQTCGSEITHEIHIQQCFSLTFENNKCIFLVHNQYYFDDQSRCQICGFRKFRMSYSLIKWHFN